MFGTAALQARSDSGNNPRHWVDHDHHSIAPYYISYIRNLLDKAIGELYWDIYLWDGHREITQPPYTSLILPASPCQQFVECTFQLLQVSAHLMWMLPTSLDSLPTYLIECKIAVQHTLQGHWEVWTPSHGNLNWTLAAHNAWSSLIPTPVLGGHPNLLQICDSLWQSQMPQHSHSHSSPPFANEIGLFVLDMTADPYRQPGTWSCVTAVAFWYPEEPASIHLIISCAASTMWQEQAHWAAFGFSLWAALCICHSCSHAPLILHHQLYFHQNPPQFHHPIQDWSCIPWILAHLHLCWAGLSCMEMGLVCFQIWLGMEMGLFIGSLSWIVQMVLGIRWVLSFFHWR